MAYFWKLLLCLQLSLVIGSCQKSQPPVSTSPVDDTPRSAFIKTEKEGFIITSLSVPESFLYDSQTDKYFISNVSGEPHEKNGEGFITRLTGEGMIDIKQFIIGLNAPKGLAVQSGILYVTDIDTVKGFSATTGQKKFFLNLKRQDAEFLNDIVATEDVLYVSDTQANVIFKIIPQHKTARVFCRDPKLEGPNGLAIHPKTKTLTVVSSKGGRIFDLDINGKAQIKIDKKFQSLDGAAYDADGNLYVSDFTAGALYHITMNGRVAKIADNLITPADISLGPNSTVLIPCFNEGLARVIFYK